MKKTLRRLMTFCAVIAIMAALAIPAMASSTDTGNTAVTDDAKGVIQIKLVYTDDDGQVLDTGFSGTGFLINESTVLTCYHVVALDDEWADELAKALGKSKKQVLDRTSIAVNVMRDVTIKAKIRTSSEEVDFAVLDLEQPLNERSYLKIRSSETTTRTEKVYALGFPGVTKVLKPVDTYTEKDVIINDGSITDVSDIDINSNGKLVNCISTSTQISEGYSGGPLVDANGNVVGICEGTVKLGNGKVNYAISIDEVTGALNQLGIQYYGADGDVEGSELIDETDGDEGSTAGGDEIADSGEDGEQLSIGDSEAGGDGVEVVAPSTTSKSSFPLSKPVMIIIIVVVVVVIVLVVLLVTRKKNNGSTSGGMIPPIDPVDSTKASSLDSVLPGTGAGAYGSGTDMLADTEDTVFLAQGSEDTVLMNNQSYGKLTRKKTGESAEIHQDRFVIGKEKNKVDYCISGNGSVSRQHAVIIHRNGAVFIMDQNSKNGTFVNDVKVTPGAESPLKNGDRITLSDEDFIYTEN